MADQALLEDGLQEPQRSLSSPHRLEKLTAVKESFDDAVTQFLQTVSESPKLTSVLSLCKALLHTEVTYMVQNRADTRDLIQRLHDALADPSTCELTLHAAILLEEVVKLEQTLRGVDEDDLDELNLIFHQGTLLGPAFDQYRVVVTCSSDHDYSPEDNDGYARQESQLSDSYSPQVSEVYSEEPGVDAEGTDRATSSSPDRNITYPPEVPKLSIFERRGSAAGAAGLEATVRAQEMEKGSWLSVLSPRLSKGSDRRSTLAHSPRSRLWERLHQVDVQNRGRRKSKHQELCRRRESIGAPTLSAVWGRTPLGSRTNSFHPPRPPRDTNLRIICRICEESVPLAQMHQHSTVCIQRTNSESMFRICDDKLLVVIKEMDEFIDSRNTKVQDGATPRITEELTQARALRDLALDIYEVEFEPNTATVGTQLLDQVNAWKEANPALTSLIGAADNISTLCQAKMKALKQCHTSVKTNLSGSLSALRGGGVGGGAVIAGERVVHPSPERTPRKKRNRKPGVSIADFEILRVISRGAYGRVFLARKRKTKDTYAIKVLRRSEVEGKKMATRILNERNILASCYNPHIVKFFYSFSSPKNLFLVTEYLSGGDCFSLLQAKGGTLEEPIAQQIIAEVTLALEFLHGLQVVHRDLKPDNILIDGDGHCKLTDFGISEVGLQTLIQPFASCEGLLALKPTISIDPETLTEGTVPRSPERGSRPSTAGRVSSRNSPVPLTDAADGNAESKASPTVTPKSRPGSANRPSSATRPMSAVCGTPDYLAPELLLQQPHSFPVDWWALGIILYEFLLGCPPFNDDTPALIFRNVIEGEVEFPDEDDEEEDPIPPAAIDIISKFLCRDPDQRLGANGVKEIQTHPFFEGVNWEGLLSAPSLIATALPGKGDPEETLKNFDPRQKVFKMSASDMVIDEAMTPGQPIPSSQTDPEFGQFSLVHAMHLADLTERAARSQMEALQWACRGCGTINEFLATDCQSCGCPEDWDPFKEKEIVKKPGLGRWISSGLSSVVPWRNAKSSPRRPSVSSGGSSGPSSGMCSPTLPRGSAHQQNASPRGCGFSEVEGSPTNPPRSLMPPRQSSFIEAITNAVCQTFTNRSSLTSPRGSSLGSPRSFEDSRRSSNTSGGCRALTPPKTSKSGYSLLPVGCDNGSPRFLTPTRGDSRPPSLSEPLAPISVPDPSHSLVPIITSARNLAVETHHPKQPHGLVGALKSPSSLLRINLSALGSSTPEANSPSAGKRDIFACLTPKSLTRQQHLSSRPWQSSRGPSPDLPSRGLPHTASSGSMPIPCRKTLHVASLDLRPPSPDPSSFTDLPLTNSDSSHHSGTPPSHQLPSGTAYMAVWHSRHMDHSSSNSSSPHSPQSVHSAHPEPVPGNIGSNSARASNLSTNRASPGGSPTANASPSIPRHRPTTPRSFVGRFPSSPLNTSVNPLQGSPSFSGNSSPPNLTPAVISPRTRLLSGRSASAQHIANLTTSPSIPSLTSGSPRIPPALPSNSPRTLNSSRSVVALPSVPNGHLTGSVDDMFSPRQPHHIGPKP